MLLGQYEPYRYYTSYWYWYRYQDKIHTDTDTAQISILILILIKGIGNGMRLIPIPIPCISGTLLKDPKITYFLVIKLIHTFCSLKWEMQFMSSYAILSKILLLLFPTRLCIPPKLSMDLMLLSCSKLSHWKVLLSTRIPTHRGP